MTDEFAELMDNLEAIPDLPETAKEVLKRMNYLYYVEGTSSEYLAILSANSVLESRLSIALRDLKALEAGTDVSKLEESYKAAYEKQLKEVLLQRDLALGDVELYRDRMRSIVAFVRSIA